MDLTDRRAKLVVRPSPGIHLDFVVTLEGRLPATVSDPPCTVLLRYVPDRDVLEPHSFATYLDGLAGIAWASLEAVGVAILEDVNNEAVPRWVQVGLLGTAAAAEKHAVLLEDRQPRWDNPALLSRLPAL